MNILKIAPAYVPTCLRDYVLKQIGIFQFISSNTTITINNASQICQQAGGHLTAFENEIERQAIMG